MSECFPKALPKFTPGNQWLGFLAERKWGITYKGVSTSPALQLTAPRKCYPAWTRASIIVTLIRVFFPVFPTTMFFSPSPRSLAAMQVAGSIWIVREESCALHSSPARWDDLGLVQGATDELPKDEAAWLGRQSCITCIYTYNTVWLITSAQNKLKIWPTTLSAFNPCHSQHSTLVASRFSLWHCEKTQCLSATCVVRCDKMNKGECQV